MKKNNRSYFKDEDIFKLIAEKAPVLVFLYRSKILYANPYAINILGYSEKELKNKFVWDIVHPDFTLLVKETIEKRLRGEQIHREYTELPVKTKKGEFKIFRLYATTVRLKNGYGGLAVGVDITKEKELEKRLYEEKEKLETVLTHIHEIISVIDKKGLIKYISPAVEKILGWKVDELIGKLFIKFIHPEDLRRPFFVKREVFSRAGELFTDEFRVLTREGHYRWVEANMLLPVNWKNLGIEGPIVSMRDITEKKLAQESVFKAIYYDPLTGLPNRILFLEKLKDALRNSSLKEDFVGIAVLDIVRFKDINTLHGIRVGDLLLKEIAEKLSSVLRERDVLGRFFADEFGIILSGVKGYTGLIRVLEKIKSVFDQPFIIGDKYIYVNVCIGISVFPKDDSDAEHLLRKAELALSKAKELGAGSYAFFSSEAEREITEIAILRSLLKDAVRNGEIRVYYQPIFRLRDMKITGLEALARWEHSELGLISPAKFIPIAEEMGIIVEMGYCISDTAIRDLSLLHSEGYKNLYVSVNFSSKQFLEKDLIKRIENNLQVYEMIPESFIIEITESTAMKDPEKTKELFKELKRIGIRTAIDDFGTGYSSMSYLVEFDIDKIKIDKSFIKKIEENPKAENVVKAVIHIASSIKSSSLAEGVENNTTLLKLKDLGCDEAQGFFLAPPMDFDSLKKFLERYEGH